VRERDILIDINFDKLDIFMTGSKNFGEKKFIMV